VDKPLISAGHSAGVLRDINQQKEMTMTTKQTNTKSEPARPKEGKKRWNRIGAYFAHEDGQGGTLLLDSLPIAFDGRIVLRTPLTE
jgi:hypothetical protein